MSDRSETNKNRNEYNGLNHLSLEELENLLEMADFSSDADAVDTDYILRILEVIEQRQKENPGGSTLLDTAKAWDSFQKNYRPLAEKGETLYSDEGADDFINKIEMPTDDTRQTVNLSRKHKRRLPLRAAYAAALVAILLLTGTLTAQALGYNVLGAVAQWTRDIFQFAPETDPPQEIRETPESPDSHYDTLDKALSAFGLEDMEIVPSWIPDQFETPTIEAIYTPYSTMIAAIYTNGDEVLIISLASTAGTGSTHYEKDETEVILYKRNGITHYIMSNSAQYSAVWLSGSYECTIYGTVSEEELKRIIDSIYER